MDYQELQHSDSIKGLSHNGQSLTVHFENGRVYEFDGVPEQVADQLAEAESPGRFFHRYVKPFYNGAEVTED